MNKKVQVRWNSTRTDWYDTKDNPERVNELNSLYGWTKFRVVNDDEESAGVTTATIATQRRANRKGLSEIF